MPVWQADGSTNDQLGVIVSPPGAASIQLSTRNDYLGRPRQGTTAAPTVAVAAGAGSGASVTSHTGTDSHGFISITAGTTPAAGAFATVTFAQAFTGTNAPIVQIEPGDQYSAGTNFIYATCTNTVLTINFAVAATATRVYSFYYTVVGGA
jgi:hypothetical protein